MDGINPLFSFLSGDIPLGLNHPDSGDPAATEALMRRIFAQALAARMGLPGAEFPAGLADRVDALLAETFDDGPPMDVRRPDQLVCPNCMQVHLPVEGSERFAIPAKEKDTEEGTGGENRGAARGEGNERAILTMRDLGIEDSSESDASAGGSMPSRESVPRANDEGTAGRRGSDDEEASIDPSMPPLEDINVGGALEAGGGGGYAGSANNVSSEESLDSLPPLLGTRGDNGGSGGANVATSNDSDAGVPVESDSIRANGEETGEGGLDDEESIINSVVRRLDAIDALNAADDSDSSSSSDDETAGGEDIEDSASVLSLARRLDAIDALVGVDADDNDVGSSENASVPSLQDAGASSSDESSMPSLEDIDDGGNATSSPGAPSEVVEVSQDDSLDDTPTRNESAPPSPPYAPASPAHSPSTPPYAPVSPPYPPGSPLGTPRYDPNWSPPYSSTSPLYARVSDNSSTLEQGVSSGSSGRREPVPQPVLEGDANGANNNNNDESRPESTNPLTHLRDYGALRVIAKANCPICLEFHEPVVALPCGHCLCEEDYGRLGGYLASDKEKLQALVRNETIPVSAVVLQPESEVSPADSATLQDNNEIPSSDARPHWDGPPRCCAWAWTPCKDANCRMGTVQHNALYSISAGQVTFRSCYPPDCTIAPDMIGGLWIHLLPRDHAPAARFQVFRRHWRGQEQRSWESDGGVLPCTKDLVSDRNDGVWALCETADAECFLSLKHHNLGETRDITTVPYETRLYNAGHRDVVWAYVAEQRRFPFVGSLLERGLWLLGANTRELVCKSPDRELILGSDGSGNLWVMGESNVAGALSLKLYSPGGGCEDTHMAFTTAALYSVHGCRALDAVFLFRRFAPENDTGELVCVTQDQLTKLWSCKTIWEGPATTRFASDGDGGLWVLRKAEEDENAGLWKCDKEGHMEHVHRFDQLSSTDDTDLFDGHNGSSGSRPQRRNTGLLHVPF